jgi:preprotein translocase subunit SecD
MGWLAAAVFLVAVSACTSSGGTKTGVEKSGGGWFQARPLIMPGQRATTVRSDPFGSLRAPTNEDAYNKLSRAQQAHLANALRGVDCAHPPQLSEGADRVVCDADSDVFLLGAPLFTGNDVTRAKSSPPSAGVAGWQVSLSLTPAAADTMSRWTSRHHVAFSSGAFNDVQLSSEPPCGPTSTTQCSDFTAYISDSVVVTVPVWFAAVENSVVINGDFNEAFATRLAHRLAG